RLAVLWIWGELRLERRQLGTVAGRDLVRPLVRSLAAANHESAESAIARRPPSVGIVEGRADGVVHMRPRRDGYDVLDHSQSAQNPPGLAEPEQGRGGVSENRDGPSEA